MLYTNHRLTRRECQFISSRRRIIGDRQPHGLFLPLPKEAGQGEDMSKCPRPSAVWLDCILQSRVASWPGTCLNTRSTHTRLTREEIFVSLHTESLLHKAAKQTTIQHITHPIQQQAWSTRVIIMALASFNATSPYGWCSAWRLASP